MLPVHFKESSKTFPKVADFVVPQSKLPSMYSKTLADVAHENLNCVSTVQAGTGVIQLMCSEDHLNLEKQNRLERTLTKLMGKATLEGGNCTGALSVGTDLTYFLAVDVGANSVQAQQKLKDVFDPRRILSPGKVLEDLRPRTFKEYLSQKLRRLKS